MPDAPAPIQGVTTATAGFIGIGNAGPVVQASSFADYLRAGLPSSGSFLPFAVRGFFENGGTRCHVATIASPAALPMAFDALASLKISILCCPDEAHIPGAALAIAAYCEKLQDRFAILQSPQPSMPDTQTVPVESSFAAYYYPWLTVAPLAGATPITVPPGGHIAGVYAHTDLTKGVQTAPAGVPVSGVQGLSQLVNESQSAALNERAINVLRSFPGKGNLVWGARTTSTDPDWKYVNVRRLLIYLDRSIYDGLEWAVFEPNGPALWATVTSTVIDFLTNAWRTGALAGTNPQQAFFVRCDRTTMTQSDIDSGRLIVMIGVAPVRPAEFVVFRIGLQVHKS